jgi:hypothetical protein
VDEDEEYEDEGDGGGGSGRDGDRAQTCAAAPAPANHTSFGLVADADTLWTVRGRESPAHVRARARTFLDAVWAETAPDGPAGSALFVVAHSGSIMYLLDAVGRGLYGAANAEVVPLLVRRREGRDCDDDVLDA